jgi:hypothetical protein
MVMATLRTLDAIPEVSGRRRYLYDDGGNLRNMVVGDGHTTTDAYGAGRRRSSDGIHPS